MKRPIQVALAICGVGVLGAAAWAGVGRNWWREHRTPTFNRDIAPIVFTQCATCHRPDGMGPFNLLNFADVKKHGRQIAELTAARVMPPWLPEPGRGHFTGERLLTDAQIRTITRWVASGALEGNPAHLPPAPQWPTGWQLGPPDLIVTMPEPFTLPADGKDVYRNFVVPSGLDQPRYIRAVEMRLNNPKLVHHAFTFLDRTGESRRVDALDPEPGFPGMSAGRGAVSPPGFFLGWQPGRVAQPALPGMSWPLEPGTDVVLQLHMRPSGKPEQVVASVGFYFADAPPPRLPFTISLRSTAIDIPAGETGYVLEKNYVLPINLHVLGILPHAHYLAHTMEAWAELPDGQHEWLISIPDWNFDWQGDYQFAAPVALPKGTTLHMRYTYDNSAANARNPNQPPQRVAFGPQSSDEMGELWLRVLPDNRADGPALERDYAMRVGLPDAIEFNEGILARNPTDHEARVKLAVARAMSGQVDRGIGELRKVLEADPAHAAAHYNLGLIFLQEKNSAAAALEFEEALRSDPNDYRAHNNLGFILLARGKPGSAIPHFEAALRLNPQDVKAKKNLSDAEAALRRQGGY